MHTLTDTLPEGLHYADGQLLDAQDHVWVTIHEAAVGDPKEWRTAIVRAITDALGATEDEPC